MAAPASGDAAGRRKRLRQYQVQLLERMQEARSNSAARISQLGVQIGPERVLLELTQAGEIVPVPAITPVPLTQAWYLGLANVRGNLLGVIDLARYLHLAEPLDGASGDSAGGPALGADCRIVTFAAGLGFNCALLVTRVYGLRQGADMRREGEQLVDADANAWSLLDLAALVRDPRFVHIGR